MVWRPLATDNSIERPPCRITRIAVVAEQMIVVARWRPGRNRLWRRRQCADVDG